MTIAVDLGRKATKQTNKTVMLDFITTIRSTKLSGGKALGKESKIGIAFVV